MRVSLFVTCLIDQLWPAIGTSTVEVLRRTGCEVVFDERQTCCGQPAFNTGYRSEARTLAKRFIEIFEATKADAIVSPSGSCTAMVQHFHALFETDDSWRKRAESIAARTYAYRNRNQFASEGFDLLPSTRSQVYGGLSTEQLLTTRAVDEARGLVATYKNEPINALYTSTCGGRTEDAENIFNEATPYLRGRECALEGKAHFTTFIVKSSRDLPEIRE